MRHKFLLLLLIISALTRLSGAEDSEERYWGRAIAQAAGSNLAIWGWDKYVIQADFADISLESWEKNLREGFEWDNSLFFTNQILHPYQGSLYFNAARNNGFGFYESMGFTAAGSLMWEYFCERSNPSLNDFITTTWGGVALGESSHRLSSLILEKRKTGGERVFREVVAAGIDPVGRLNSYLYGELDPVQIDGKRPYYDLQVFTGAASSSGSNWIPESNPFAYVGFRFQYGNPYSQRDDYKPYDYYFFNMGYAVNLDNPTMDVFAHALVWGKKFFPTDRGTGVIGIFQQFDYLENFTYKFASNGAGAGVQFYFPFSGDRSIETMFHLNGVALGGVDSKYSQELENRDYSMGPGFSSKASFTFRNDSIYTLNLFYNRYFFTTISGSDNFNTVGIGSLTFEYNVTEDVRLGFASSFYDRWSDAEIDSRNSYAVRVYVVNNL